MINLIFYNHLINLKILIYINFIDIQACSELQIDLRLL